MFTRKILVLAFAFTALSASAWALGEPEKESPKGAILEVPLVEKASVGGQVRVRAEYKDPVDYRIPGTQGRSASEEVGDGDEIALSRIRVHLDLSLKSDIETFIEMQDSRTFGQEGGLTGDTDTTDLHQGWVKFSNIKGRPLSVTLGRMEVPNLGDARLVANADWHNMGRSLDGAAAVWTPKDFWVQGSVAVVNEDASTREQDQYLGTLYASYRGIEKTELDAYVFLRDYRNSPVVGEDGASGDVSDATPGVRAKTVFGRFDATFEAALQVGDYANDDVLANACAVTLGYSFDHDWKPWAGVEVTRASGDDDPTDGDRGTFDPLLSQGHAYHGYYDVCLWKNVRTIKGTVRVQPEPWLTLQADGHAFMLDEDKDAWYSVSTGAPIRRDASGNAGDVIGTEVDLHAKIKASENSLFWVGYSRFMPGSFVRDTGPAPDGNWYFCSLTVSF